MTETYMDRLKAVKHLLEDPETGQMLEGPTREWHAAGQQWLSENLMSGMTTGEPLSLLVSSLLMSLRPMRVDDVIKYGQSTLGVTTQELAVNGVCVAHPDGLIRGDVSLARAILLHEAMHLILMHNIRLTELYTSLRAQGYIDVPGRIDTKAANQLGNLVIDVVDDSMGKEAAAAMKNASHAMLDQHQQFCTDQLIPIIDEHCENLAGPTLIAEVARQNMSVTDAIATIIKAIPFNQEAADDVANAVDWVEEHVQPLEDDSPESVQSAKTIQAAIVASAGKQAGEGSPLADLCISALEYLKPAKVSWQDQLESVVTSLGEDLSYSTQAQNDLYRGIVLPDYGPGCGALALAFDTSGSVWCDPTLRSQLLTEMAEILAVLPFEKIYFMPTDEEVNACIELKPGDPIPDKHFQGGGGTSFNGPFRYIDKHQLEIDCCIYMTDGWGRVDVMEPEYPVIWLLGASSTDEYLPFGNIISVAD